MRCRGLMDAVLLFAAISMLSAGFQIRRVVVEVCSLQNVVLISNCKSRMLSDVVMHKLMHDMLSVRENAIVRLACVRPLPLKTNLRKTEKSIRVPCSWSLCAYAHSIISELVHDEILRVWPWFKCIFEVIGPHSNVFEQCFQSFIPHNSAIQGICYDISNSDENYISKMSDDGSRPWFSVHIHNPF